MTKYQKAKKDIFLSFLSNYSFSFLNLFKIGLCIFSKEIFNPISELQVSVVFNL